MTTPFKYSNRFKPRHSGFSLIEVLVSIVIVSLGLLAVVGMQVMNIKYINDSKQRSIAAQHASDMLDRMRSNTVSIADGSFDIGFAGALPDIPQCLAAAANCTPAELAAFDLGHWLCSLGSYNADAKCTAINIEGQLPSGQGSITRDAATGTTTVSVRWLDQVDKTDFTTISMSAR